MAEESSLEELRVDQEQKRFETLKVLYAEFINEYSKEYKESVYLNKELLFAVVRSYFDDIYRFKSYSGSERADNHKQAAYTIKWLSKFRPVQLLPDSKVDKFTLFINSSFALFCGFSFLELKISDSISPKYFQHLLYVTQYRNLSGKQLASLLYVLECSVNNETP